MDHLEIERRQEDVSKWQQENPSKNPEQTNDESIQTLLSEIGIIHKNIKENKVHKQRLEKAIQELDKNIKRIIEEFPRRITKQERRQLLQLLIQSQNLELVRERVDW